jgi:DNA-binding NtrC family response regulator/tetratricopeptide (TPR) repeat protein
MGEIEAKRGLLDIAVRHTQLGERLLGGHENLWLSAVAANTLAAISIMRSDVQTGVRYGRIALEFARKSGAAAMHRAALGNLGNLHLRLGNFSEAIKHFEAAGAVLPTIGERENGGLDSLALVCLAQGRIDEAVGFIERIDRSILQEADWLRYSNRHTRLSKAMLLLRLARFEEALHTIQIAEELALKTGDKLLMTAAALIKAEILLHIGRQHDAVAALTSVTSVLPTNGPQAFADYHRVLACAFMRTGQARSAEMHFQLARRVYQAVRSVPSEIHLNRAWLEAGNARDRTPCAAEKPPEENTLAARELLHNVNALLLHADRPELVATGLLMLLKQTRCVRSAAVVRRDDNGTPQPVASFGESTPTARTSGSLAVGLAQSRQCQLVFESYGDIESATTLEAVKLLLTRIHDLERAQAEREERLTLWPLEELPLDDTHTVINGKMREVMTFARRVAPTNVSVLITGESGTGKEILARAIHTSSPRAAKPFVPFNCTAVPRELLESHLFGYRRGAFTGAERDYAGLIRTARDGTLFLDEIGELGIDLQPKLLRFLESGEIHPLGEPGPLTVNVRVIAATNANLEQLVNDGRFREDLFYRLNVIRLTIPPLRERRDEIPALVHHFVARAAAEFGKGRVRVAEETMEQLLLYPWPGNVRQLQNELRRMVALAEADAVLEPHSLSQAILRAMPTSPHTPAGSELAVTLGDKLQPTINRIEREMIKVALRTHQGRVEAAAKALGISRKGLYLKRQRLGL